MCVFWNNTTVVADVIELPLRSEIEYALRYPCLNQRIRSITLA